MSTSTCVSRTVLLVFATAALFFAPLLHSQARATGPRDATKFPGASIVEQIQAALNDCGPNPCEVYVPAGTYNASPVSTWRNKDRDGVGVNVGVAIPSDAEIRGAGRGHTIIKVTRSATDPSATLFANANRSNRNIHLSDMSISWTDSAKTFDLVTIFICHGCDQLELDHLSLEGNPNKLVNLLDSTGASVHDNQFLVHATSYGHGDNALSINRFSPVALVGPVAGVVRDNQFTATGDDRTFSLLVITQSGVYVHSNIFEAHLPPPGNATGIEAGQGGPGRLAENVKISGNIFRGASIAHVGLSNSEISGNFLENGDIYVGSQDSPSLTGLTIANNELRFGSISITGVEHSFTGRLVITHNRIFEGNIGTGAASIVHDVEVSYNSVRYSANTSGISCYACSVVKGNVVRENGQNVAAYLIGGVVQDVSDNIYIDEQHDYDAGTICSVANPSSTVCLSEAHRGASRWILLRGGEWGFGWTNRTLYTDRGNFPIHAFVSNSLLELVENESEENASEQNAHEKNAPILPAGTRYHLSHTTFVGFELNNATIERFANNMAVSTEGFHHAAVQESGTVRIRNLSGNVFHPYSCYGKCAIDYRSTMAAPEPGKP
jgi:hypothetical protein